MEGCNLLNLTKQHLFHNHITDMAAMSHIEIYYECLLKIEREGGK